MKLNKTLIRILMAALAIVWVYLLIDCGRQVLTQRELNGRILDSNQALLLVPIPTSDLGVRLEAAQKAREAAQNSLAADNVNSTNIIDSILKLADQQQVKVNPVTAGEWKDKVIGSTTYQAMEVTLKVRGRLSGLTQFIEQLENHKLYPGISITGFNLFRGEGEGDYEVQAEVRVEVVGRGGGAVSD